MGSTSPAAFPVVPPSPPLLEIRLLMQRLAGVVVLDNLSMTITRGEIVGVMGASGAGKSALLQMLAGQPIPGRSDFSGRIFWEGKEVTGLTSAVAARLGIALVPQFPRFPPVLTVAEAISLGQEPRRPSGLVDRPAMHERARSWMARLGHPMDPGTCVGRLSPAQQQIVAWTRALSARPKLLLLDDPTACLRPRETDPLFETLGDLQAQGTAIVFASNRLAEIQALASRLYVLRDGRLEGHLERGDWKTSTIHRLVMGELSELPLKELTETGPELLNVSRLRTLRYPQAEVNFSVRAGEIVGMAGLVGSGRASLLRTIFGLSPPRGGAVFFQDRKLRPGRPHLSLAAKAVFVEGRAAPEAAPGISVQDALTLPRWRALSVAGIMNRPARGRLAALLNNHLSITEGALTDQFNSLTANQRRKVAIARALVVQPAIALLNDPTRGVSLQVRAEIYECLERLAERGAAVIFSSSQITELLQLSDRILVFRAGALAGTLTREDDFTERGIMRLAAI